MGSLILIGRMANQSESQQTTSDSEEIRRWCISAKAFALTFRYLGALYAWLDTWYTIALIFDLRLSELRKLMQKRDMDQDLKITACTRTNRWSSGAPWFSIWNIKSSTRELKITIVLDVSWRETTFNVIYFFGVCCQAEMKWLIIHLKSFNWSFFTTYSELIVYSLILFLFYMSVIFLSRWKYWMWRCSVMNMWLHQKVCLYMHV